MPTSSTSLGASIVPASSSRTIQRALRTGTLDSNDRLVGGEGDSASENEDPALQEVLELLKKGEVYNLGPDGNYIHTIAPHSPSTATSTAAPSETKPLPSSRRSQISKFKPSRPAEGKLPDSIAIPSPSSLSIHESLSPSITPISHEYRSSPKLEVSQAMAPQVYERRPLSAPASSSAGFKNPATLPFSMIVDSPSFPAPQDSQGRRPAVPPTVISSSSIPPTHPDRRPAIISSPVTQSNRSQAQVSESNEASQLPVKTAKVSRFKAERL